jgi:hypothetical protein
LNNHSKTKAAMEMTPPLKMTVKQRREIMADTKATAQTFLNKYI